MKEFAEYKGKRILVTGHNGYIGSLLVKILVERGYDVIGIDTNYFGEECNLYQVKYPLEEIKKDIRGIAKKDLECVSAICHLAALSNDPVGELNPELTAQINYHASRRLAKLAKDAGVKKFVYSSSCSLYGIAGETTLAEDSPLNPRTAYAKSKVATERNILPLADKNFCVTVLRNSTAYGISPKLRVDLVVNNLVGWAVTTGEIKILSDGTPWRPLIHAEDIAGAFAAVIEAPEEVVNGECFNVGSNSENYQIRDIAYMVKDTMPNCKITMAQERGTDERTYKVNFDKINKQLPGFTAKWTLKKGIKQICEYYRKYAMNQEKFGGRYFIRLKQLKYLLETRQIDQNLFWL